MPSFRVFGAGRAIITVVAVVTLSRNLAAAPPQPLSDDRAAWNDSATAIVDVTVIPMDRDRTVPGQTVIIEHGRITALGPVKKIRIPVKARRVDGHGKFLIPGLSDMHVHLQGTDSVTVRQWLLFLVASGVTTVRNMDYQPRGTALVTWAAADMIRLREQVASGEVLGPRIYTSGWWGDRTSGWWAPARDSAHPSLADVERKLVAYKAQGYDFVKVHDEGPDVYRKLVIAAKAVGIPFAGHVPDSVPVEEVIAAHQQSIEHLKGYMPAIRLHATKGPLIIAATKAAHVWNCPTLLIAEFFAHYTSPETEWPEVKRYFLPEEYQRWSAERAQSISKAEVELFDSLSPPLDDMFGDMPGRSGSLPATRQFVKAMQDSGVGLLTGTDLGAPVGASYLGFALPRELAALVRAGLTPYQTLVASTRNAAEFSGTLSETGTIEVGKRADLVLLNGNPLTDIKNTMLPAGVIVHGRWLSRAELDARLSAWHPVLYPDEKGNSVMRPSHAGGKN